MQVDLTLHGHHHSYQRTCPVAKQVCQATGPDGVARAPVHLVIGNGGAGLTMGFQQPPPAWLEVNAAACRSGADGMPLSTHA